VHLAYQDHEQVLIAKTSLVTRPVRIELAAIGIIQFLSPTVAKVIGYRTAKLHRDAKYLKSLSGTHVAIPFGTPIDTANGCTLRLDSDGSLYHASWYEDTARVLLREYSRMATLDCLCRQPRYYVHDPLTELLSSSLLGTSKEQEDLLASYFLHCVLDVRVALADEADRPYIDARTIASSRNNAFNLYHQTVRVPCSSFEDPLKIVRDLILTDRMVVTINFGQKRMDLLQKTDEVLAGLPAHHAQSAEGTIKRLNSLLPGRLVSAALHGMHMATAQVEQESPIVIAFLLLDAGLCATGWLSEAYPDAEQIVVWFTEEKVFGTANQNSVPSLLRQLREHLKPGADLNFLPATTFEVAVQAFMADENETTWRALRGLLVQQYHKSIDEADPIVSDDNDTSIESSGVKDIPLTAKKKHRSGGRHRKSGKQKSTKPGPTDIELLTTMHTLYSKDDQIRASFNFLAFRHQVMPVLLSCAETLMKKNIRLSDDMQGLPNEILRFVEAFFGIRPLMPALWDEIARELAHAIRADGREQLDAAEAHCGFSLRG
jgi:hypothetical protein